jgi:hypothetical protein
MTTSPSRTRFGGSTRSSTVSGLTTFAGVMLVTLGILQILQGITAVAEDTLYVTTFNYVYSLDISSWGWIHMALGAVAVATGLGLFAGQSWARIVGIALASLSAINSFMFLPYYPLWSIVVIALDVLVIWALCVQIGEAGEY